MAETVDSVEEFLAKSQPYPSAYSHGNTDTNQSHGPNAQPGYAWTVTDNRPASYPYPAAPQVYQSYTAPPYSYAPYNPNYSTVAPGYVVPYQPATMAYVPQPPPAPYPAPVALSSASGRFVGPSQDVPDPILRKTPNRGPSQDTSLENFTSEANLKFENELRQTFWMERQPKELFQKIIEAHRIKEAKKAKLLRTDAADQKQQPTQVPSADTEDTRAGPEPQVGHQGPRNPQGATTVPGLPYPYPMYPPAPAPNPPSQVPGYVYPQYPPQQPWPGYPYPPPPPVQPPYFPSPQPSPAHHTADEQPAADPPGTETFDQEELLKRLTTLMREEKETSIQREEEAAMAAAVRAEEIKRAREEGRRDATMAAAADAAQAQKEQRLAEHARTDAKLAAAVEAAVVADRQELMYVKALRLFEERERYALDFANRERRLYREALRNGLQIGASGGGSGRSSMPEKIVARELVDALTKRAEIDWESEEEEGDHVEGDSDSEPYQRAPARRVKMGKWHPKLPHGTVETLKTSAPSIPLAPELPEPNSPEELDRGIIADETARLAEHTPHLG